jgi:hypothetical protein
MWLSACGPQHPRSRGASDSYSRGVCLIQRLNDRGYTSSSHGASAFVTCSKRSVRAVVPGVYADNGVSAPPIEQGRIELGANGGFIAHQFISENGKPLLKFEDSTARCAVGWAGRSTSR